MSARHVNPQINENFGTKLTSNRLHTIQYNFANREMIIILSDMYCYNSFKEYLIK